MQVKYVNPFTDFGFKKIFGEEASKPLLRDFLHALLPQQKEIIQLTFKNTEQLGQQEVDRKAMYDIYCENADFAKGIAAGFGDGLGAGKLEAARVLKQNGVATGIIAGATGLSTQQIDEL